MKRVLGTLGDWSNEDWRLNDKGWCGQIVVIAKIFEYDCITKDKSLPTICNINSFCVGWQTWVRKWKSPKQKRVQGWEQCTWGNSYSELPLDFNWFIYLHHLYERNLLWCWGNKIKVIQYLWYIGSQIKSCLKRNTVKTWDDRYKEETKSSDFPWMIDTHTLCPICCQMSNNTS